MRARARLTVLVVVVVVLAGVAIAASVRPARVINQWNRKKKKKKKRSVLNPSSRFLPRQRYCRYRSQVCCGEPHPLFARMHLWCTSSLTRHPWNAPRWLANQSFCFVQFSKYFYYFKTSRIFLFLRNHIENPRCSAFFNILTSNKWSVSSLVVFSLKIKIDYTWRGITYR